MGLDILTELCDKNRIAYRLNEPMKSHTSFKIGGPAEIFISPADEAGLCGLIKKCRESGIPYFVLGKGSNILVSDSGIDGAVISTAYMNKISVCEDRLICEAGASLSEVCRTALENSLSGLEFAYGVPGSVGGALYMNAGAYGGEMSDIVEKADFTDENGDCHSVFSSDMKLGYRTSIFKAGEKTITRVTLKLSTGKKGEIESKMNDYIRLRREKQPLEYPSAGSTFKRPEGHFAGALIEKNGLKGFCVGGAAVSDKHAGFIINHGNAKASDVKRLMDDVRKTVLEADGVELEPEVILIGNFNG